MIRAMSKIVSNAVHLVHGTLGQRDRRLKAAWRDRPHCQLMVMTTPSATRVKTLDLMRIGEFRVLHV